MPWGAGTGREGTKHRGKEMLRVSLVVVASAAGNLIPGTRAVRFPNDGWKGGVCSQGLLQPLTQSRCCRGENIFH